MVMARLIIVFLLIIAVLVAYSPQARESMSQAWDYVRPAVVALMDGLYAAVRTLIAGDGRDDQMDNEPVAPGVNFDRIVTMASRFAL